MAKCSRGHSKKERKELIKMIELDGWYQLKGKSTSHLQFKHPVKRGKVTIPPYITKNIELSVLRQAGLRVYKTYNVEQK